MIWERNKHHLSYGPDMMYGNRSLKIMQLLLRNIFENVKESHLGWMKSVTCLAFGFYSDDSCTNGARYLKFSTEADYKHTYNFCMKYIL